MQYRINDSAGIGVRRERFHSIKGFPMKAIATVAVVLAAMVITIAKAQNRTETPGLTTVKRVELKRYAGKWYEISKIPNRFQRQCVGNTTAQYTIRDDGRIDVINRCQKENGDFDQAIGIAKAVDPVTNAKLKVSFVRFLWRWWFWGDYWIIGLGTDYTYAIVGTPSRKYGWVLSRTPEMNPDQYESVVEELRKQGYNPGDFERTQQQSIPPSL
jgi:apolipoprotein D and lipocalin family protein